MIIHIYVIILYIYYYYVKKFDNFLIFLASKDWPILLKKVEKSI